MSKNLKGIFLTHTVGNLSLQVDFSQTFEIERVSLFANVMLR